MLMIIITKDGIIVDFGKPTMFIDDKDFETIQKKQLILEMSMAKMFVLVV